MSMNEGQGGPALGKVTGSGLPAVFGSWVTGVQAQCPDLGPVAAPQVIPMVSWVAYGFKTIKLLF